MQIVQNNLNLFAFGAFLVQLSRNSFQKIKIVKLDLELFCSQ